MAKLTLKKPQSKLGRWWQKLNQDDMPKTLQKGKYTLIFCFTFFQVIGFLIFYVATHINSWIMAFQQVNGVDNQGNEIIIYSLHNFQEFFRLLGRNDSGLYIGLRNTALYFILNTFVLLTVLSFSPRLTGAKTRSLVRRWRGLFQISSLLKGRGARWASATVRKEASGSSTG